MNEQIEILDKALANIRDRYVDKSWQLFLWGSLSIVACVAHYIFLKAGQYNLIAITWFVMMAAAYSIQFLVNTSSGKTESKSTTVLERSISLLWLLMGGTVFFLAFIAPSLGLISYQAIIPLLMMQIWLASIFTAVSIKYKPFIVLSNIWLVSLSVSFLVPPEQHILLFATSIGIGYLLPGLLLRKERRNSQ